MPGTLLNKAGKYVVYLRHKTVMMSTPKLELFDKELQKASAFFKALSHPARLAILNYLAQSKVCITGVSKN